MTREVFILTCLLALGAVLFGLWWARAFHGMDEGTAIAAVARHHVSQHGGQLTDCSAVPGENGAWLRIICGDHTYRLARDGRILQSLGPQT